MSSKEVAGHDGRVAGENAKARVLPIVPVCPVTCIVIVPPSSGLVGEYVTLVTLLAAALIVSAEE